MFALKAVQEIYTFYRNIAGVKVANKVIDKISDAPLRLLPNPYIGKKDEIFVGKREVFILIESNYKIIYHVDLVDESIVILDVFDARQNPVNIDRSISRD